MRKTPARVCNWNGWSDWASFDSLDFKRVSVGSGAYVIVANSALRRVVGTDTEGILHVGEATKLRERIRCFLRCAGSSNASITGHMAGWRFSYLKMASVFPLQRLRVRWKATATKEDAYSLEGDILRRYSAIHFELPPLNYKFNWSHLTD